MKNKLTIAIAAITVLVFINTASAQNRISSPYSRFGIGELFDNTHVNNMAMGGLSQAIRNPYFVNQQNPATYSSFDSISFIFDISAYGRITDLRTAQSSQSADYASIGNLLFGFPVNRWWRASFGLLPYSTTGYKVTESISDTLLSNFTNVYEGTGGINQFYIGSSFRLNRKFSVGFNAAYLFGTMNHSSAAEYPETAIRYNAKLTNSTAVHDFLLTYGVLYTHNMKKGLQMNLGATFNASTSINSTIDRFFYTYNKSNLGYELIRDTIDYENNIKEKITLPMGMGAGFSIGRANKWLVGSDVRYKQWEDFKFSASPEPLVNNTQISVGGFYNPTTSTVSNYFSRITYRAGFRYSNGFLQLRDQRINDFGISFGVGLPLPRTYSTINMAVEVGSRGTTDQNLIKENYVKFTLGLSIFERWFIIRKYE